MKKYYITNCGLNLEIAREKAIKIKTLQTFYKLREEGKNTDFKEVEKKVREQFKK